MTGRSRGPCAMPPRPRRDRGGDDRDRHALPRRGLVLESGRDTGTARGVTHDLGYAPRPRRPALCENAAAEFEARGARGSGQSRVGGLRGDLPDHRGRAVLRPLVGSAPGPGGSARPLAREVHPPGWGRVDPRLRAGHGPRAGLLARGADVSPALRPAAHAHRARSRRSPPARSTSRDRGQAISVLGGCVHVVHLTGHAAASVPAGLLRTGAGRLQIIGDATRTARCWRPPPAYERPVLGCERRPQP